MVSVSSSLQNAMSKVFAPSATTQFMTSVMNPKGASTLSSRIASAFNYLKECIAFTGTKREVSNLLDRATTNLNPRTLSNFLTSVEKAATKAGIKPSKQVHSDIACALVKKSTASSISKQALLASIHQKYQTNNWGPRHVAAVGTVAAAAAAGAYFAPENVRKEVVKQVENVKGACSGAKYPTVDAALDGVSYVASTAYSYVNAYTVTAAVALATLGAAYKYREKLPSKQDVKDTFSAGLEVVKHPIDKGFKSAKAKASQVAADMWAKVPARPKFLGGQAAATTETAGATPTKANGGWFSGWGSAAAK